MTNDFPVSLVYFQVSIWWRLEGPLFNQSDFPLQEEATEDLCHQHTTNKGEWGMDLEVAAILHKLARSNAYRAAGRL